jgi:GntR family transcriptional regulator, arabinose operon transcriptional repressor
MWCGLLPFARNTIGLGRREMTPIGKKNATPAASRSLLHRTICEELRTAILGGKYQQGDKLPSEAALCEQFNASRITVAKALQTLQTDRLVVRRAGSGTYVQLLALSGSHQFGLLIPELGTTEIFEPICQGIMRSPLARSHSLVWGHAIADESGRQETAAELCHQFIAQKVAGVFFAPLEYADEKDLKNQMIVAQLRQANIPVVLLDRCYETYPQRSNLDRVGIDNHRASFVMTEHLWKQGARRIIFLAKKRSATTIVERISGYYFALKELSSKYAGNVFYSDCTDPAQIQQILQKEKPDAVVCGNDLTAAKLMRSLIGLGVRIPGQLRLGAFDDVSYAKFLPVPLTTIHQNCQLIGESAITLMLDRIQNPSRPGIDILVPFDLVVRDSCGAPAASQSK